MNVIVLGVLTALVVAYGDDVATWLRGRGGRMRTDP